MVGMGALVTKSVPDFHLVIGHPARSVGTVCRCGHVVLRFPPGEKPSASEASCPRCDLRYVVINGNVVDLAIPAVSVH
jgi:hypothetical protein